MPSNNYCIRCGGVKRYIIYIRIIYIDVRTVNLTKIIYLQSNYLNYNKLLEGKVHQRLQALFVCQNEKEITMFRSTTRVYEHAKIYG